MSSRSQMQRLNWSLKTAAIVSIAVSVLLVHFYLVTRKVDEFMVRTKKVYELEQMSLLPAKNDGGAKNDVSVAQPWIERNQTRFSPDQNATNDNDNINTLEAADMPTYKLYMDPNAVPAEVDLIYENTTFYRCGYDYGPVLLKHIYPEWGHKIGNATHLQTVDMAKQATKYDILIMSTHGDCEGPLSGEWLEEHFLGKIITINGESVHARKDKWTNLTDLSKIPRKQYQLGFVHNGCQSRYFPYIVQHLGLLDLSYWKMLMRPELKPKSKKERFLIYVNSHSVPFRENAFDEIALRFPNSTLEYGATCHGKRENLKNVVKYNMLPHGLPFDDFSYFRFCFVLENRRHEGYITEKIINAFLGGCIP